MTSADPCDFVLAHATEGRLRLRRSPTARLSLADGAKAACSLERVHKVRYAELTGSLIIEHDYPEATSLFAELATQHDIMVGSETALEPYAPHSVKAAVGDLDRAISSFSGGEFDLNALISATLFGFGMLQFRNGKFLPAGLTLLFQANSYFRPPPVPREPRKQDALN